MCEAFGREDEADPFMIKSKKCLMLDEEYHECIYNIKDHDVTGEIILRIILIIKSSYTCSKIEF